MPKWGGAKGWHEAWQKIAAPFWPAKRGGKKLRLPAFWPAKRGGRNLRLPRFGRQKGWQTVAARSWSGVEVELELELECG